MALTVGSLFSGVGMFDLGLERAGMATLWQVERDEWCRGVLAAHFPNAERFADVRDVGAHDLAPVDLICGGFPCQPISNAGKRRAQQDERWLWPEFARIVRELRPRYVFVENVAALLDRGLGIVRGDLAALGFDAEWDCIPASAVGAPHRRDRIWILAQLADPDGVGRPHPEPREHAACRGDDALGDVAAGGGAKLADAISGGRRADERDVLPGRGEPDAARSGEDVADAAEQFRNLPAQERACAPDVAERGETVGHPEGERGQVRAAPGERPGRPMGECPPMEDAASWGSERRGTEEVGARSAGALGLSARSDARGRGEGRAEPRLVRGPDGDAAGLDGYRWPARPGEAQYDWEPPRLATSIANRTRRLKAIGNALVPQIPELIGRRIVEAEALRSACMLRSPAVPPREASSGGDQNISSDRGGHG